MTIPSDFYFSQARLQDYVECRRRFQLRYLLDVTWPAVESEPVNENESHLQMGGQFHHLIHQHLVGIKTEQLSRLAQGEPLQGWWQNYLDFIEAPMIKPRFAGLDSKCFAEISLSSTLGGYRLIGKFDVIVVSEDQDGIHVSIYDWKTSSNRPPRAWLANRLQTRIYPYLLIKAGDSLNPGKPIHPDQVEMIYWFANFPNDPEYFNYSQSQFDQDHRYLTALVEEITQLPADAYSLTSYERNCRFCTYRSLCDRGTKAGLMDEIDFEGYGEEGEQPVIPILDFEQVGEIEF